MAPKFHAPCNRELRLDDPYQPTQTSLMRRRATLILMAAVAQLLPQTNSQMVKTEAIIILAAIGPAALPSIRQAMKSPDPFVRGLAMYATEKLGTNAALAIPDLRAALSDPDLSVRTTAKKALQAVAPDALVPQ